MMKLLSRRSGKVTPKILSEQIDFWFDVFPITASMLTVSVLVIAYLVWSEVSQVEAIYWLAVAILVVLARVGLYYGFKSAGTDSQNVVNWCRAFILGAFLSACVMCFAGVKFFPHLSLTSQMVFILLIIGVVSGALPILSTDLKYYVIYLVLNIGPVAFGNLASEQMTLRIIGALTFVFIGMMVLSGYLFSRALLDSLVYRYRSEVLAERLQIANNRLSAANQELQEISTTDELTGLYNRRYFNHRFGEVWADHLREGGVLSALMIDVDYFKLYNDNFGHLQGDNCLKRLAEEVMCVIQRPRDFVARFGGEEFIVLLPNTSLDGAKEVASRIHTRVEHLAMPHKREDQYSRVTVSIGGSMVSPKESVSKDSFLQRVDQALYQAKRNGRNMTVFI